MIYVSAAAASDRHRPAARSD